MSGKKKSVVEKALPWLNEGGFFEKPIAEPDLVQRPLRWDHVKVDMSGFSLGSDEVGSSEDRRLADDILKRSRSLDRLDAGVNTLVGESPMASPSRPIFLLQLPYTEIKAPASPAGRSVSKLPTVTVAPEHHQHDAIFKTLAEVTSLVSAVSHDISAIESSRVNSPRTNSPRVKHAPLELDTAGTVVVDSVKKAQPPEEDIVYARPWPKSRAVTAARNRGIINWNYRPSWSSRN